jgi:hypothetical protein
VLRPMIRARSRAVMPRRATIVELVRKRIAL